MERRKRGRPKRGDTETAQLAGHIIDVALAVSLGQWRRVKALGYTRATAERIATKRHRGAVGALIGSALSDLLPQENQIARAVQVALEHLFTHGQYRRFIAYPPEGTRDRKELEAIRNRMKVHGVFPGDERKSTEILLRAISDVAGVDERSWRRAIKKQRVLDTGPKAHSFLGSWKADKPAPRFDLIAQKTPPHDD